MVIAGTSMLGPAEGARSGIRSRRPALTMTSMVLKMRSGECRSGQGPDSNIPAAKATSCAALLAKHPRRVRADDLRDVSRGAVPHDPACPRDSVVIFDLTEDVEHRLRRHRVSGPDRAVAKMRVAVDVRHDVGGQRDAGRAAQLESMKPTFWPAKAWTMIRLRSRGDGFEIRINMAEVGSARSFPGHCAE